MKRNRRQKVKAAGEKEYAVIIRREMKNKETKFFSLFSNSYRQSKILFHTKMHVL